MIAIQIVPKTGQDAYKLLRDKVTHEARTWSWSNKAKTRLVHKRSTSGYIEVTDAEGILLARIISDNSRPYFLLERFVGRLVAWFQDRLFAINIQFMPDLRKDNRNSNT